MPVVTKAVQHSSSPDIDTISAARQQLWAQHCENMRQKRHGVLSSGHVSENGFTMPFWYTKYGSPPSNGHSLYISLHGGGSCPAAVNTQSFHHMKTRYRPSEGIYLVPRAPTDTWDMWHQSHVDSLFQQLISDFIIFENVNPDRVFIIGYSAGGDGVYQLAPRFADRLAAATMCAGHPNDACPKGLRNLPFMLHMGAQDAAYNRHLVAAEWERKLAELRQDDPQGYVHHVSIHPDMGHDLRGREAVALDWMAHYSRCHRPERVVWVQSQVAHNRFYWLYVEEPKARSEVTVERNGQEFTVLSARDVSRLTIRLDETMVDFNSPVIVRYQDRVLFSSLVQCSIEVLEKTLAERSDPCGIYCAEFTIQLS